MNCDNHTPFLRSCTLSLATPADMQRAFRDLNKDMNPEFIHLFLDKLERYAKKPDRALFLVEYKKKVIAFATIINKSSLPDTPNGFILNDLNNYACGTGLMVLKEHRRKGVASLLVKAWEHWAKDSQLLGIWVITHKMSNWYQTNFGFSLLGVINLQGVQKSILAKKFLP